jgi:hypothetical protein
MINKPEIEKILRDDLKRVLSVDTVYKYTKFDDGMNKILLKQSLKFSDPTTYNDPFDCNEKLLNIAYTDELVDQTIAKIGKGLSRQQRRYLKRNWSNSANINKIMRDVRKEYKLTCFSETNNEVIMWSHYAESHSGMCIGFNFPYLYENKFILCSVKYLDEILPLDAQTDTLRIILYWLTTKSIAWSFEKEIRAITKAQTVNDHEFLAFDSKYIKEIVFGCRVSSQQINEAIHRLKQNNFDIEKILFKRMEINEKSFLLKEVIIPVYNTA